MTSDAIQLPDAPGIHGLRFRHFRGGDDFNHMATIARASALMLNIFIPVIYETFIKDSVASYTPENSRRIE